MRSSAIGELKTVSFEIGCHRLVKDIHLTLILSV